MDKFLFSDKYIATRYSMRSGFVIAFLWFTLLSILSFSSRQPLTNLNIWIFLSLGLVSFGGIIVDFVACFFKLQVKKGKYYTNLLTFAPFVGILTSSMLGYFINGIDSGLYAVVPGAFGGTLILLIFAYDFPEPPRNSHDINHYKEVHKSLQKISMEKLIIISYDYFPEVYRKLNHKSNKDNLINLLLEVDSEKIYYILTSLRLI